MSDEAKLVNKLSGDIYENDAESENIVMLKSPDIGAFRKWLEL
jgi:hypothetical protein